jgi:Cdc6-like AAA superfamily ATPase
MYQDPENPKEYARTLTDALRQAAVEAQERDLDTELLEYWCQEVEKLCRQRYKEYVKGTSNSHKLSDKEMFECLTNASMRQTSEALESLVEKGVVKMSVNDKGEILYRRAEENN